MSSAVMETDRLRLAANSAATAKAAQLPSFVLSLNTVPASWACTRRPRGIDHPSRAYSGGFFFFVQWASISREVVNTKVVRVRPEGDPPG